MLNENECAICFEEVNEWEHFTCNHKICKICYSKLLKMECPFCRCKLIDKNFTDVESSISSPTDSNIDVNINNRVTICGIFLILLLLGILFLIFIIFIYVIF